MTALTNKPCEIDFHYEKGKLTLDLRICVFRASVAGEEDNAA
jgi:hypothetical protein